MKIAVETEGNLGFEQLTKEEQDSILVSLLELVENYYAKTKTK